jgi:hypothetical protein
MKPLLVFYFAKQNRKSLVDFYPVKVTVQRDLRGSELASMERSPFKDQRFTFDFKLFFMVAFLEFRAKVQLKGTET